MSRSQRRVSGWGWAAIGVVVLALVAAGAWLAWSGLGTYRQAQAAAADLQALRASVAAQDWRAAGEQFPGAQQSVAQLVAATDSASWRVLESLPGLGTTATAAGDLADAADQVLRTAAPLVPYAQRITDGQLRGPDGAFDVAAMREVAPLLTRLSSVVTTAVAQLDAIDTDAVRPEVAGPLADLRGTLADAQPALAAAASTTARLPGMLGADGPRDWLVLLQNPSEARGTGGFVGGYVVVRADAGRLSIVRTGTSSELAPQPIPDADAPADARTLWGDALQRWGAFNVSPHFPTAAVLAQAGMARMGTPVDGVVAIDPAAVAALLAVTGPVSADGVTIDAAGAERFFTVDMYRTMTDNAERDRVTMDLIRATFDAVLGADLDVSAVGDTFGDLAATRGVQVFSGVPDEQEWLATTAVGGVVPDAPGPVLTVAFNNSSQNKTDAFVRTAVEYEPGQCPTTTVQHSTLTVRVANDAPADLPREGGNYNNKYDPEAAPGSTNELVHIYAPVGANFRSATIDGTEVPLYLGAERGRPVWWTYLPLDRGDEHVIVVQFDEPTVLGVEPAVLAQPMVIDEAIRVTPRAAC